jgi:hypothetical protein
VPHRKKAMTGSFSEGARRKRGTETSDRPQGSQEFLKHAARRPASSTNQAVLDR